MGRPGPPPAARKTSQPRDASGPLSLAGSGRPALHFCLRRDASRSATQPCPRLPGDDGRAETHMQHVSRFPTVGCPRPNHAFFGRKETDQASNGPQGATSTRDGCAARILPGLPVVIGKHRVNTSQSGCGFGVIGARTMSACRPPTGPARRYQYPARDDGALFQTGRGGVLPLRVARPAEARGLVAISETPRPSGICVGASGATKCRLRPPASVGNVDCLAV